MIKKWYCLKSNGLYVRKDCLSYKPQHRLVNDLSKAVKFSLYSDAYTAESVLRKCFDALSIVVIEENVLLN